MAEKKKSSEIIEPSDKAKALENALATYSAAG